MTIEFLPSPSISIDTQCTECSKKSGIVVPVALQKNALAGPKAHQKKALNSNAGALQN